MYELVTFFSFSYCAKWILGLKGLTQLRCLLGSCEVWLQCTFNSQGDVTIVCFTLLVNKYRHLRHQILISKKLHRNMSSETQSKDNSPMESRSPIQSTNNPLVDVIATSLLQSKFEKWLPQIFYIVIFIPHPITCFRLIDM